MPVLVTHADGALGRALVMRLLEEGGEVRAYCTGEGPRAEIRAAGAVVASGDLDDEGHLEAAMAQVHTVIDLSGGPLAPDVDTIVTHGRTVLRAAVQAGARRLIRLSVPGADPAAGDPLRRAEAHLEAACREAEIPTVVVRCSLVDEPAVRDAVVAIARSTADDPVVAPVNPEDLIEALAILDAVRSRAHTGHVVFSAEGARMPLSTYVERIAPEGRVGRRYVPRDRVELLVGSFADPWVTDDPAVFDVWEFTGHEPRGLELA